MITVCILEGVDTRYKNREDAGELLLIQRLVRKALEGQTGPLASGTSRTYFSFIVGKSN